MTEQRYTLEEAQAELARRRCHVTGHQVDALTLATLSGSGPLTYHCGVCSESWMVAQPMIVEGPFTIRAPHGADDRAYELAARDIARALGMEVAGGVKLLSIDTVGSAAGYRRMDMTLVHRDRKMMPAPTDDSWIKMDELERPTK